MTNPLLSQILHDALNFVNFQLFSFTTDPEFHEKLTVAFGNGVNSEFYQQLWTNFDFNLESVIEIRTKNELNGANGAFSRDTGKIYLAEEYLQQFSILPNPPSEGGLNFIASLILEEYGHLIDAEVNSVESLGDEGAIFAQLVQGKNITAQELQALQTEDDTGIINLNGQVLAIEMANFTGTNGNDNISGTSGNDTISPLRGYDIVDGGEGNDLLIVDYSSNTYTGENAGIQSNYYFKAYYDSSNNYDYVQYSNIERFDITGTIADDWINIGWNTDTINIDGRAGFDTLRYGDFSSLTTPVTINELGTTTINLPDGSTISNIEYFHTFKTGSGNDVISLTEHLDNDIKTGSGDDTINPGGGYDFVDGGEGNDLLIVDYSSNTYTGENAGIQSNYYFWTYYDSSNNYDYVQYSNIERFNITGTIVDDWINIGWNTDTINIDGRAGFDTLRYGDFSSLTTPVTINELGTTTINLPDGSSISNIEYFYSFKTGSGNDVISFTEHLDNDIETGSGDDTINPGGGYNVVDGGEGNDLLIVDYSSNTYTGENAGIQSNYNFKAYYDSSNNYDYVQYSNIERFKITGTIADDYIQTGDGNDTLAGFDGNDSLIGGAGDDRMLGGKGDDTYYLSNTRDRVIEKANEGTDTVISTITYALFSNVENLILEGTDNINGTGNISNNIITGNTGNNRLNGRAGADTMVGGLGDDTYFVDNTGDVIIENADEGIDTVRSTVTYTLADNIEHLLLAGTDHLNGTGNVLNNDIKGNQGNNILSGGDGNDTLTGFHGDDSLIGGDGDDRILGGKGNDTLIGGMGNDTLIGGLGRDVFRFDSFTEGLDRITDFNVVDDTIEVSASGFGGGLTVGTLLESQFTLGSSASTEDHRFIYNSRNGALFFDVDGSGTTSAVQIATLNRGLAMTHDDIVVI